MNQIIRQILKDNKDSYKLELDNKKDYCVFVNNLCKIKIKKILSFVMFDDIREDAKQFR
jgi:hypothetical protein